MKRLLSSALLACTLVACGGTSKPAAPADPEPSPTAAVATCEQAITRIMALQGDEMFGNLPLEKRDRWKAKFAEVMLVSCREDRWSSELLTCAADAADTKVMDACSERMPPAEQAKLQKRVDPFMRELKADVGADVTLAPAGGATDEGLATLTLIRDHACACKDAACIEEVTQELAAAANKRTRDMDAATRLAGEISECMAKVSQKP
jgi:hypothetical protein